MLRYIDADALISKLAYHRDGLDHNNVTAVSVLNNVIEIIERRPTVSPDEVRGVGKWDRVETGFGLRCPKCGKLLDEYVNGGEWVALSEIPNYCPQLRRETHWRRK